MSAVVPQAAGVVIDRLPPSRETILRFERHLAQFEQRDCPLKHTFAPGVYLREIFLPAGTFIVGKIHKHAHHNVIVRGHCTVVTEFGLREVDARAGHVSFVSEAGAKRALYVHEDTVWMTIHRTDSTDLAEIEREIIAPTFDELDAFLARARELIERGHVCPGSQLLSQPEPL